MTASLNQKSSQYRSGNQTRLMIHDQEAIELLRNIWVELQKMNMHLALGSDNYITEDEIIDKQEF